MKPFFNQGYVINVSGGINLIQKLSNYVIVTAL